MLIISAHLQKINKHLAPLVAKAWIDIQYKNQLVGTEWNQADLDYLGIVSDAKVRFVTDEPKELNFVLRHDAEGAPSICDQLQDVWFEPSRSNSNIEFRYFSPIRLPRNFIHSIKALAGHGTDSPTIVPRPDFISLTEQYKCNLGAIETISIWKNSQSLRYFVLPRPPDGLGVADYSRVARAGDWLYYATFANFLTARRAEGS